jgi:predicted double-glycine peptidase
MLPIYLKTVGVLLGAGTGAVLGLRASRWKRPWWFVAYVLPLALVLAIVLARRLPRLEFAVPIAWLMAGRTEFAALGFAVPLLLATLIPRLARRREQVLLWVLVCSYVIAQSASPFLLPAFSRASLAALETTIDGHGVCLQSTGYTCGAASAVTALRQLGIEADEGELAILSHTSRLGTDADLLCEAINRRFAGQGVRAECRWFGSVAELRGREPVLAAVRFRFLIDHFVTVLSVGDSEVIIGDPLTGRETRSYEEFAQRWRRYGVTVARPGYPKDANAAAPSSPTSREDESRSKSATKNSL